jgi:hypothetical protein
MNNLSARLSTLLVASTPLDKTVEFFFLGFIELVYKSIQGLLLILPV